jgi:hypothetical protein
MNSTIKNILVGVVSIVIGGAILILGNIQYQEYREKNAAEDYRLAQLRDNGIKGSLNNLWLTASEFWDKNTPNSYKGFCEKIKIKENEKSALMDDWEYLVANSGADNSYCKVSEDYSNYKVSAKLSNDDYYCVDKKSAGIVPSYLARELTTSCSI